MPPRDEELAALLLETMPMLMGDIRERMMAIQQEGDARPTLAQYRVLGYIGRHEGTSLTQLAGDLKLALPAASKLVQSLVENGFVQRDVSPTDRRQAVLRIGPKAKARWERARVEGRAMVAQRLQGLTGAEREQFAAALKAVRRVLAAP